MIGFFKELEKDYTKEIPWRIQVVIESNTILEKAFERGFSLGWKNITSELMD